MDEMAEISSKDPFGINPLGDRRRRHISDDPGNGGADNEEDQNNDSPTIRMLLVIRSSWQVILKIEINCLIKSQLMPDLLWPRMSCHGIRGPFTSGATNALGGMLEKKPNQYQFTSLNLSLHCLIWNQ